MWIKEPMIMKHNISTLFSYFKEDIDGGELNG